ncbi:MAG: DJ-1/PfpI family protein [Chitinophagales bacterium]|nr:DJ-1/PfpI family protein [Chitinophagales bacterium]
MKKIIVIISCQVIFCLHLLGQHTSEIKDIALFLQEDVEALDFAGPLEVFVSAGFNVYTVSVTKEPIKSLGMLTIIPDYDITDCPQPDILAFFGGGTPLELSKNPDVMEWIIKTLDETPVQFSVCTGAYFLGEAGYLDHQMATTYHLWIDDLQDRYPKSKVKGNVRFVDNGKVITTAGVSAGIDGALHLVSKLKGRLAAQEIAKGIEYDKWIPDEGFVFDHPFLKKTLAAGFEAAQELLNTEPIYKGELLNLSEKLIQKKRYKDAEKCIHLAMDMEAPTAKDYELLRRINQAQHKFVPPSEEEYFQIIREKGIAEGEHILKQVKQYNENWIITDPMQFLHFSYIEYYKKNKIDEAIELMKLQLQHHPEYVYYHYWMGRYFEEKNMLQEALTYYEQAVKLDATFVEAIRKVEELKG